MKRLSLSSINARLRTLTASFYILSLIVVTILLVAGTTFTLVIRDQLAREQLSTMAGREAIAVEQAAQALGGQLSSSEGRLRLIAQMVELQIIDPAGCNAKLEVLRSAILSGLENIARADSGGGVYCAYDKRLPGTQAEADVVRLINDPQHKTILSRMASSADSGYKLRLHVPVYGIGGEFTGVLSADVSQSYLTDYLGQSKIWQNRYMAVVDDNGDFIYSRDPQVIGRSLYEQKLSIPGISIDEFKKFFEAASRGAQTASFKSKFQNDEILFSVASLEIQPGRHWVVYSGVSAAEVYKLATAGSALKTFILLIGIYSLLVLLGVGLWSFLLKLRLARPGEAMSAQGLARRMWIDALKFSGKTADRGSNRLKGGDLPNGISDGLVVFDREGNVASMNPAAQEILTSGKEAANGHLPGAFREHQSDRADMKTLDQLVVSALATGKMSTKNEVYRRKDGSLIDVSVTVSPVVVGNKPIGAIKLLRDITHERQLDTAKEEFVALASHQLRSPAAGIKASISMILDGYLGEVPEAQRQTLHKVFEANERQIQVVNDLLNVARLDAGRMEPDFEMVDLCQLIREVGDEQLAVINERRQSLDTQLPRSSVAIEADPRMIRMVIENFLTNASKYTPNNGKLYLLLSTTDKEVNISIRDSGVGIARSDIPKLFKRFSRVDNALSKSRGGTGLGLYLANSLVRLHRGRITVESKVGRGTRFDVHLPFRQPGVSRDDHLAL